MVITDGIIGEVNQLKMLEFPSIVNYYILLEEEFNISTTQRIHGSGNSKGEVTQAVMYPQTELIFKALPFQVVVESDSVA